jgi:hypothetical protein
MKTQKSILPTKAKWVSKVIGFSLLSVPLMSNLTHAQSAGSPAPQSGFRFQQSEEFNMGVITKSVTQYNDSGGCQSYSTTEEIGGQAVFISSTMPPAPGLRVAIRNVTPRIDQNPSPYTDREYHKAPNSEGFKVSLGTTHSGRYLAVQPGENHFYYEIKSGNTIIESGTFNVRIDHKTQNFVRGSDRECQRENAWPMEDTWPRENAWPMEDTWPREFDPLREDDLMREYHRQKDKPRRRR